MRRAQYMELTAPRFNRMQDRLSRRAATDVTGVWFYWKRPIYAPLVYSLRKATMGLTRVARRIGIEHARRATSARTDATPANVRGSVGLTPNSNVAMSLVSARAAATPATRPININFVP